jgi:acyl CoA:acetate/3-ketoacid CoA transferase alpha subunit
MAMAADCTIVEAEEVVATGDLDPDFIHTSGVYVNRIVKIPPDGILHVHPRLGD